MDSPEYVIYIQGIGDQPKEQERLAELWEPYGLCIEPQLIDWTSTDYEQRLEDIGNRVEQLSEQGKLSMVGASGGGKPALSLFASHPDSIHRVITISSKVDRYVISPVTRKLFPNLVISSDVLPNSLKKISGEMLKRILCLHPLSDDVVAPKDAVLTGANYHTVQANGHIPGIAHALTVESGVIADFIRRE